jgi:hypothetical protein
MYALACTVPLDNVTAPAMAHIHSPATLRIPDLSKLSFYVNACTVRGDIQTRVSISLPLRHRIVFPCRLRDGNP